MPAIVSVVGGLVVLVGALLAVDWFTAGRAKGRLLVRANNQSSDNLGVGYAAVESNLQVEKYKGEAGG
jgi:hypothetical protein